MFLSRWGIKKKKIYLKIISLNILGVCCVDCRWIVILIEMKYVWAFLKEK